jgi:uncharacterized repeat protein (TIGR01451 family)
MGSVEMTVDETTPVDLAVELSDSPDPAFVGESLAFTLEVTNVTGTNATGVEASALLPPQVTLQSAPGCTSDNGIYGTEVICTIGSVLSGATATRTVTTTPQASAVAEPYIGTYGFVDGNQADPDADNNYAFASTVVQQRPSVVPDPIKPAFNVAAAIKKCKKKFRGKKLAKKRAKCIKKARRQGAASASAAGVLRPHPFVFRKRPPGLERAPIRSQLRRSRR